jgi:hypothetical protein
VVEAGSEVVVRAEVGSAVVGVAGSVVEAQVEVRVVAVKGLFPLAKSRSAEVGRTLAAVAIAAA